MENVLVSIGEFYVGNKHYRLRRPQAFVVSVVADGRRAHVKLDCRQFNFVAMGSSIQLMTENFSVWIDALWTLYVENGEGALADDYATEMRQKLLNMFEKTVVWSQEEAVDNYNA